MARITAPEPRTERSPITIFEDDDPYPVQLKSVSVGPSKFPNERTGEPQMQLALVWTPPDDPEYWIFDWVGLSLGNKKGGTPSKMRMLLNALAGEPADTRIEWFDPETLEWGYQKDGPAYSRLTEGMTLVVRGETMTDTDSDGNTRLDDDGNPRRYFRIQKYRPESKSKKAAQRETASNGAPARNKAASRNDAEDGDPDEIPF